MTKEGRTSEFQEKHAAESRKKEQEKLRPDALDEVSESKNARSGERGVAISISVRGVTRGPVEG